MDTDSAVRDLIQNRLDTMNCRSMRELSARAKARGVVISPSLLSKLAHGPQSINPQTLSALAAALEIPQAQVLAAVGREWSVPIYANTEDAITGNPRLSGEAKRALLTLLREFEGEDEDDQMSTTHSPAVPEDARPLRLSRPPSEI